MCRVWLNAPSQALSRSAGTYVLVPPAPKGRSAGAGEVASADRERERAGPHVRRTSRGKTEYAGVQMVRVMRWAVGTEGGR